jgi:hypothetical protein
MRAIATAHRPSELSEKEPSSANRIATRQEGRMAMLTKKLLFTALPHVMTLAIMAGFIWTGLGPGRLLLSI